MEGFKGRPPASLIPYYWSPGWNSQQASNKYLDKPNGNNIDGEPGKKILAENGPELTRFFTAIPKTFSPVNGELCIVPFPQIFGSEELSSYSKPVMERMTSPILLINESEKQKIHAGDNPMMLSSGNLNLKVTLRIDNSVPSGIGALTCSLPGMDYLEFPFTGTLVPV
jgi:NADH-quinone oxidoreductase subunit G